MGTLVTTMDKYIKNKRVTKVKETDYGVYVWKMPDGAYLSDGEDRLLSINSRQGDLKRMAALQRVVRSYGIEKGEPHYLPDRYKVTDGEYESMMERLEDGYIPDPGSPGNLGGDV